MYPTLSKLSIRSEVFSKNRRRKRPNLSFESLTQVAEKVEEKEENYKMEDDIDLVRESDGTMDHQRLIASICQY